ncbi:hypothetical protein llap_949 [Limosa lapponica baueri]|uniref:Uncharacterized protein n=1 Tax=Limosa lapponica baueri TaxID=1758121 RepID=A0A2I0URT8_LIMLA|nr:hypothetical protein llap_949 [Limosa lapponica baueri]
MRAGAEPTSQKEPRFAIDYTGQDQVLGRDPVAVHCSCGEKGKEQKRASTAGCSHAIPKNGYGCNLTEEKGGERVRSLAVRMPHVVCDYMS